MEKAKGIAAVTGGSGMIGQKIANNLLQEGYVVRILTRNASYCREKAQMYYGDIENTDLLRDFLKGVSYLFHCAAELNDESKMWNVNVLSTERILNLIPESDISHFCYLSSAGVIGLTDSRLVDEESQCNPQNAYEKSKRAAEELVANGVANCNIVILRPTNVIDENRPGALALPIRSNWRDRISVFIKGGECAHVVHADDVADAAIYLIDIAFEKPAYFFVSCDEERFNTFAGLWSLYDNIKHGRAIEGIRPVRHLPISIPHLLRRLWRGPGNYGDICYSSRKLLSAGYRFNLGVEGAVRRIVGSRLG